MAFVKKLLKILKAVLRLRKKPSRRKKSKRKTSFSKCRKRQRPRVKRKRAGVKQRQGTPRARKLSQDQIRKKHLKKSIIVSAGVISHYFPGVKAAVFKTRCSLQIGDPIWIKGKTTDFRQTVGSLQVRRSRIEKAAKGIDVGLEVYKDVRVGDEVYLQIPGR